MQDMPGSNIDLPASPYTIVAFGAGDGRVETYQGTLSLEAAVRLMVERLEDFDWPALQARGREHANELAGYEDMLDLVSLVAEINLYLSRLVWSIKAPAHAGLPRLLARAHEADELRYLANLATQRSLSDDELALHLLEQGEFMSQWGEVRRVLVIE